MTQVTRARDVRATLRAHGMEVGTRMILEQLAEDNEMLRQEMTAITNLVNKMADIVADMAAIGKGLKNEIDKIMDDFHPDKDMQ